MMLEYRTARLLPLNEILTLLDKVKAGASHFVGFSPQASQFGGAKFKRQLPTLDQMQGVELRTLRFWRQGPSSMMPAAIAVGSRNPIEKVLAACPAGSPNSVCPIAILLTDYTVP